MNKTMTRNLLCGCLVAAALLSDPTVTSAVSIPILNPSFETPVADSSGFLPNGTPVDDWTSNDPFKGGIWNIENPGSSFWSVPAPDGEQVIYLGYFGIAYVDQTLSETIQANSTYTLTGYVATLAGYSAPYLISLRTGATELASITGTPSEGTFDPFALVFNSTGSAFVGQPLTIRLQSGADGSSAQDYFDGLELNRAAVPEPSTLVLVAVGGLVALISRKRRS